MGVEEGVSTDAAADLVAAAAGAAGAAVADVAGRNSAAVGPASLVSVMEALASGGVVAAARAAWAKLAAFARSPNAAPVMMVLLIISMKLVARMDADGQPLEMQPAVEAEAAEAEAAAAEEEDVVDAVAAGGVTEAAEEEAAVGGLADTGALKDGTAHDVTEEADGAGQAEEGQGEIR